MMKWVGKKAVRGFQSVAITVTKYNLYKNNFV